MYFLSIGPGSYDVKAPDVPGGNLVTKESRFKQSVSDVPGPGTYQVIFHMLSFV